jgi:geranylgeranyl diphosphate synthase, type II
MSPAPTITEERLVPSVLQEYGEATRTLLFRYLPDAEPRRYLYDLLPDYPRRGGRSFRPSLCIATARAFGTPIEAAIRTAVSIELMHNAMLIHDDIQDESEQRRGRPTLHSVEGIPIAINVGDLLSLMAMRPLLDNRFVLGHQLSLRIIEETERMARESAEGQALELGWRRDNVADVAEPDYLEMVLKKTCWLATIHPSRVGALIGTGGTFDLDSLIRFGFFLGAAFQIQDDLLNLVGDPETYGKELSGDIREGKRTLMLIHLFEQASPAERTRLRRMLGRPRAERSEDEVGWARERMDAYGCIDYARQVAQGLAGAAHHEFTRVYAGLPDSRDKHFIEALPTWVIERR